MEVSIIGLFILNLQIKSLRVRFMRLLDASMEDLELLLLSQSIIWFVIFLINLNLITRTVMQRTWAFIDNIDEFNRLPLANKKKKFIICLPVLYLYLLLHIGASLLTIGSIIRLLIFFYYENFIFIKNYYLNLNF